MEHRKVVFAMHRFELLRRICIREAVSGTGLHRGQLPVLEYIIANDACTQVEIAEKLHVSPASIAGSVKRLRAAGLIECRPDERDLRRNMLMATGEGRSRAEEMRGIFDSMDQRTFTGFSEEELSLFYDILCRMMHNIAADHTEHTMFELMEELKELEEHKSC